MENRDDIGAVQEVRREGEDASKDDFFSCVFLDVFPPSE
jgi:hypothetical protein